MIGYKEHKRRLSEQGAAAQIDVPHRGILKLNYLIDKMVDDWVKELKASMVASAQSEAGRRGMVSPTPPAPAQAPAQQKPGFLHRFRNLIQSLDNESVSGGVTLAEFRSVREAAEGLDQLLKEEAPLDALDSLPFMKLLNQKAAELKQTMKTVLSRYVQQPAAAQGKYQMPPLSTIPKDKEPDKTGKYQMPPISAFPEPTSTSQQTTSPQSASPQSASPQSASPQTTSPQTTSPQTTSPQSAATPPKQDIDFGAPGVTDKAWNDLSKQEKELWNILGGDRKRSTEILPVILRLGDPRRQTIGPEELDKLKKQNRLEDESEKIMSLQDLLSAKKKVDFKGHQKKEDDARASLPTAAGKRVAQPEVAAEPLSPEGRPSASGMTDLNLEASEMDDAVDEWPDEDQEKELHQMAKGKPSSAKIGAVMEKMKEFLRQSLTSLPDDKESTRMKKHLEEAKSMSEIRHLISNIQELVAA